MTRVSLALFAVTALTAAQSPRTLHSRLNIFDIETQSVTAIYRQDSVLEAPNWSTDGKYLLFNSGGNLYRIAAGGGNPEQIDLHGLSKCNNDKGYSPDGKLIALSSSANGGGSQVYVVAAEGGEPKLMVPETPSYFHAFSPDGKYLSFVAQRNGNFDLFRILVSGGKQQQLTTNAAYDDGPDYSPDGKWIYFNSNRSGKWEIWRMPANGAGANDQLAEQVTFDEVEDWFPHCSPDGKWLVFVSFPKGTATHNDRLPGVELRLIPLPGETITRTPSTLLQTFYGGQGTINVNSWSPDSKKFAYVSFEPAPKVALSNKKSLNLAAIKTMVAAAEAEAAKRNVQVTICIVDESGNLLFLEKADGASLNTLEFAQRKARHAAFYGSPSKNGADALKKGNIDVLAFPQFFPNQGGLPIKVDGETIGGISASGAKSEIDEAIAQAGLDALFQ